MLGKLITFPLRVSIKSTELALRATRELTETAWHTGEQLISLVLPGHDEPAPARPRQEPPAARRESTAPAAPAPEQAPRASRDQAEPTEPSSDVPRRDPRRSALANGAEPPVAEPRPARTEPPPETRENVVDFDRPGPLDPDAGHVSEEVELVEERADPGVEDGVGAQIRVDEPFEGYRKLNAQAVIARVSAASEAELTAMRLYEGLHRKRETVLRAIDRQLVRNQNAPE